MGRDGMRVKKLTLLLAIGLLGGVVAIPVDAQAPPSRIKVPGGQPTRGWSKPMLVSADQAHREASLAISPVDPSLLFICSPSGVPNTEFSQSYFHVSRDGGRKWEPLRIEGPSELRNYFYEGGDCDVAFDKKGTMYTADTWRGNLSIGHSTDKGKTWEGTPISGTSPMVDRPWLVGGTKGVLHVAYQDLQCCMPSAIWYTRSSDYGQTFLPAVPVAFAGPEGAFTWEGNLVVAPGAEDLYLVYTRRSEPSFTVERPGPAESVWVAASHDGGLTWNSHLVARRDTAASFLYPSIAMDRAGLLHVVFSSPTRNDVPIWYSVSKDKGESWTNPRPLMRGAAGYSPWVTAGARGQAAVVWYGSPDQRAYDTTESPWYFYWARVSKAHSRRPHVRVGRTTTKPMFVGKSLIPEFETVRLDERGRMHIAMSARWKKKVGTEVKWVIYYQVGRP
ncbi:MAG TPA: exo-alpha-sialidase [Actinomycetota bacterium]|nr:exo-alpha-sialidase [Actinomycetota bacterium]